MHDDAHCWVMCIIGREREMHKLTIREQFYSIIFCWQSWQPVDSFLSAIIVLQQSYDNTKVTIDSRQMSSLQNTNEECKAFLMYDSVAKL